MHDCLRNMVLVPDSILCWNVMDCNECKDISSLRSRLEEALEQAKIKCSLIYSGRRVSDESMERLVEINDLIKSYVSILKDLDLLGCNKEAIDRLKNKVNRKIKELECY